VRVVGVDDAIAIGVDGIFSGWITTAVASFILIVLVVAIPVGPKVGIPGVGVEGVEDGVVV